MLGLAATWADRWTLNIAIAPLWAIRTTPESALVNRSSTRALTELSVGYRALLVAGPVPVYLVPTLGGALRFDSDRTTTTKLELADPACAPSSGPCDLRPVVTEDKTERSRLLPTLGLDLNVSGFDAGYSFQLHTSDVGQSSHRVFVGIAF